MPPPQDKRSATVRCLCLGLLFGAPSIIGEIFQTYTVYHHFPTVSTSDVMSGGEGKGGASFTMKGNIRPLHARAEECLIYWSNALRGGVYFRHPNSDRRYTGSS